MHSFLALEFCQGKLVLDRNYFQNLPPATNKRTQALSPPMPTANIPCRNSPFKRNPQRQIALHIQSVIDTAKTDKIFQDFAIHSQNKPLEANKQTSFPPSESPTSDDLEITAQDTALSRVGRTMST